MSRFDISYKWVYVEYPKNYLEISFEGRHMLVKIFCNDKEFDRQEIPLNININIAHHEIDKLAEHIGDCFETHDRYNDDPIGELVAHLTQIYDNHIRFIVV